MEQNYKIGITTMVLCMLTFILTPISGSSGSNGNILGHEPDTVIAQDKPHDGGIENKARYKWPEFITGVCVAVFLGYLAYKDYKKHKSFKKAFDAWISRAEVKFIVVGLFIFNVVIPGVNKVYKLEWVKNILKNGGDKDLLGKKGTQCIMGLFAVGFLLYLAYKDYEKNKLWKKIGASWISRTEVCFILAMIVFNIVAPYYMGMGKKEEKRSQRKGPGVGLGDVGGGE